ncbi:MAG: serine/threonine protein kinase [Polyangiales bacterium]
MAAGIPIGPYTLLRKLARGGMAEIFLARKSGPEGFARDLVIKRMLPHLTANPELSNLFKDEARIAAQMNHPNVVHVYDFGEHDGAGYLVMELVRGIDLHALIERARIVAHRSRRVGAIPARHAVKLLSFVCEGLAHAHGLIDENEVSLGVVHRDVTPSNVLVSFDGAVKVADFGVAKLAGRADSSLLGKAAYLSPEQARQERLDTRSDLYNVGILLFEMITGDELFPHDDEQHAKELAREGQIPAAERLRDLGGKLEAVARRALAPLPEDRYQDALELRMDLEKYLRGLASPTGTVELAQYVRALFPDVLAADRSAPRAAGTVVTRLGTEPLADGPAAPVAWSDIGKHIEKTMVDPVVHPVRHPTDLQESPIAPPFLSLSPDAAHTVAETAAESKAQATPAEGSASKGSPNRSPLWFGATGIAGFSLGLLVALMGGEAPTELLIHAPDGATVVFDQGPRHHPGTLETTPGLHEVRVEKLGFEPFVQQLNLQEGTRTVLEVGLTPRAP